MQARIKNIAMIVPDALQALHRDLCFEAIRLALLLSKHPEGDRPKTHALFALLCFHAARLAGRIADDGALIQLEMQDRKTTLFFRLPQGEFHLRTGHVMEAAAQFERALNLARNPVEAKFFKHKLVACRSVR